MAKSNAPLIRQLSEKHRKLIRSIVKRYKGELSRDEYYRCNEKQWSTETDKHSGKTRYALLLENLKTNELCTDEEAAAMAAASLSSWDLLARGVARRIVCDDCGELECALSLGTRIEWVQRCFPGRHEIYPEIWSVFRGLAASDVDVARAFFGDRPRALSGGHKPTVLIYNAVQAIITENRRARARILPEIEYPDVPDCYRAVLRTLHGVIEKDATAVAVGLENVLATFLKLGFYDYETIICLIAHGLAELAYWISPRLLEEFDVGRSLPWDSGYYQWLRRAKQPIKRRYLTTRNSLLHRLIHDLEEPGWWHRHRKS